MNNAEILIKFKGDASQAEEEQKKIQREFEATKKKGEIAFAGIAAAATAMTAKLLKSGVQYNAEIEGYLTRLTTLTGSFEKANDILNQIKQDALTTPFEVSSLTEAESLLLSTGLSAEQARNDILALGDAIAASGGGNEELSRMAVNLQQIKNVGKASALDIKQFAFAGIDIYGLLADSMGVTREEASELDVSYEMLSKALSKASKEGGKYYGAMENQSKTFNGAMSNLQESAGVFAGAISEELFGALKSIIPALTDMFDWMTQNKDLIIAIGAPILTFISILGGMMLIGKIAGLFNALWVAMTANPIGLIVAALAGLVVAFTYLWNHCEGFRNFFIGMWEGIKLAFEYTIKGFEIAINWIVEKFVSFKDTLVNIGTNIKNFFANIGTAIANVIKTPINWIIGALNTFIKGINKIKIPDWVPGVGGYGFSLKEIPKLNVGTNYVPQDTLAMIHEGEAVVPKKFNPFANGINQSTMASMNSNSQPIIKIYNNMEMDALGQVVNNIKTYSGGSKNDYSYGGVY